MPTTPEPLLEWALDDIQPVSHALPAHGADLRPTTAEAESSHASLRINRPLYISHFLSTWNVRGFEFGAVLFLASIFPGTLLPMSVYALVRAASAIFLSPLVGRYIDSGDRLQVIRVSIGKLSRPSTSFSLERAAISI